MLKYCKGIVASGVFDESAFLLTSNYKHLRETCINFAQFCVSGEIILSRNYELFRRNFVSKPLGEVTMIGWGGQIFFRLRQNHYPFPLHLFYVVYLNLIIIPLLET